MGVSTISSRVRTCGDGLTEGDTEQHSWEVLGIILQSEEAKGIVCDIGM